MLISRSCGSGWPTRPDLQIINPATRALVTMIKPSLLMGDQCARSA
jgi:hypothetical protein